MCKLYFSKLLKSARELSDAEATAFDVDITESDDDNDEDEDDDDDGVKEATADAVLQMPSVVSTDSVSPVRIKYPEVNSSKIFSSS